MASIHSRHIAGNLVFYDTYLHRLVDAVGADVYKAEFGNAPIPLDDSTGDPTVGTFTVVEAGTGNSVMTAANASGGGALITTADGENDGISLQLHGESFSLASTVSAVYFGAFGVTIDVVAQSDLFLGLAITDTAILGGATDSIGFRSVDGSATLSYILEQDSSEETGTAGTIVDAAAFDCEFFYDGSKAEFFYNGASVAKTLTELPEDEEMRVSWEFLAGADTTPSTCSVRRITCIQIGR